MKPREKNRARAEMPDVIICQTMTNKAFERYTSFCSPVQVIKMCFAAMRRKLPLLLPQKSEIRQNVYGHRVRHVPECGGRNEDVMLAFLSLLQSCTATQTETG